jgi:hypothetical protein
MWEMKGDSVGEKLYSEGSGRVNRPNGSYIRFQHNSDVATICFFADDLKQFSWMQVGVELEVTGKNRVQNAILIEEVERGNLLSVDGKRNSKKWLRLHVSKPDSIVLREWLKIDRTVNVRVPILMVPTDQTSRGFVVQFGNERCVIPHGVTATAKQNLKQMDLLPTIDRMLLWFAFDHLPDHLKVVSQPFFVVAHRLCELCDPGPERTVALRKLLEAKDAAVRAKVNPGC